MEQNSRAELTCLLSDTPDDSLLKRIMEAGYRAQNLNYRYIVLQVQKGEMQRAMDAVRLFGIKGINLAVPYRREVIPFLDDLSLTAEMTGVVDTICCQDGRLVGENTVGKGLVTSLMEREPALAGRTVVVLGNREDARAAAVECAVSGAGRIYILGTDKEAGESLAELIGSRTRAQAQFIWWKSGMKIPENTDILVNTADDGNVLVGVSDMGNVLIGASDAGNIYIDEADVDGRFIHRADAGEDGNHLMIPDIDYEGVRKNMIVCDMSRISLKTVFLELAQKHGAEIVSGAEMFINQAVLNYSLWTEHIAPGDVLYEALCETFIPQQEAEIMKNEVDIKDRQLIDKMMEYYAGDPKRIQHFLKVYTFAGLIGEAENLPREELFILKTAAIVHDIGIKVSEEKYGSSAGKYQEKEGPAVAEPLLRSCGYEEEVIDRVLFLIANHHTYDKIEGADYQILVEADFLVNLYEDGISRKTAENVKKNIFRTEAGTRYLEQMYLNIK